MERQRGFLLIDALLSILLVTVAADFLFRTVTGCLRRQAAAKVVTLSAMAAEEVILREALAARSLLNPAGRQSDDGERTVTIELSGRAFAARITKEVIPECPGLNRWIVIASPVIPGGSPRQDQAVRLEAASFDPF